MTDWRGTRGSATVPRSKSYDWRGQTVGVDAVQATLVVDSRTIERYLGTRSVATAERQLVFRGGGAYVELRLPPPSERGLAWVHGQYLARAGAEIGPGPLTVRMHPPYGDGRPIPVGATGDFSLAFRRAAHGPVTMEFVAPAVPALVVRFES